MPNCGRFLGTTVWPPRSTCHIQPRRLCFVKHETPLPVLHLPRSLHSNLPTSAPNSTFFASSLYLCWFFQFKIKRWKGRDTTKSLRQSITE